MKNKPSYLQLYEKIKNDIISGVYLYHEKLPSKRVMADKTGVSVITVAHAYDLLFDEGYIEPKERSGYFVIYKEDNFSSYADNNLTPIFNNHKPHHTDYLFPYSVLAKTVRKVLSEKQEELLVKSPNLGCAELRNAICSYLLKNYGINVESNQIVIGSGAEYLYGLIVQLLGNDKVFALENPCYEKIARVYNANKVACEFLKLGHDGIKTAELKNSKATVLHITPFNSYPSGITASASKRKEYIKWAKERDGFIIEDNYDGELTVSKKNEDTVFSLSNENVIYLNTFSKTIAPSLRAGYIVLPKNLIHLYHEKLGFYSCTVPVLEQYVLAELLISGDFVRHINRVRRKRRKVN